MQFTRKSVKIIAYSSGYIHSRIFSAVLVRLVMDHNESLIRFIIYINNVECVSLTRSKVKNQRLKTH